MPEEKPNAAVVGHRKPGKAFWPWQLLLHGKVAYDALAFSADGETLAVGVGGEIALVETGSGRKRLLVKGLPMLLRLTFAGPTQLAARFLDGTVKAWDVVTGKDIDPQPAHARAFQVGGGAHRGREDAGGFS